MLAKSRGVAEADLESIVTGRNYLINGSARVGAVGSGPHTPTGVEKLAIGDVG